jgi:hypothetical protein
LALLSNEGALRMLGRGGLGSHGRRTIKYLLALYANTILFKPNAAHVDDQGVWYSAEKLQSIVGGWGLASGFLNTVKRHMTELENKGYVLHKKHPLNQADIYCLTKVGTEEAHSVIAPLTKGITPLLVPLVSGTAAVLEEVERARQLSSSCQAEEKSESMHLIVLMGEARYDHLVPELTSALNAHGLSHRVNLRPMQERECLYHIKRRSALTSIFLIDSPKEIAIIVEWVAGICRRSDKLRIDILVSSSRSTIDCLSRLPHCPTRSGMPGAGGWK